MSATKPGWGWWPPLFAPPAEQEWSRGFNRSKREYDLFQQVASVVIVAGLALTTVEQLAKAPRRADSSVVFFVFALARTALLFDLIKRSSPWFLAHRSAVFACSQVSTALMYAVCVMRVPWTLVEGASQLPHRLPAGGAFARVRFLVTLPMLQLHMGLSGIDSVRARRVPLLMTLGVGLVGTAVRCHEEAANAPASGPEYAKIVEAAEATLAPWVPAVAAQAPDELGGAAACMAVNVGIYYALGYALPMAVLLIEETISRHSFACHAAAAEIYLRPPTPTLVAFYTASALLESAVCFSAAVAALRLLPSLGVTVF